MGHILSPMSDSYDPSINSLVTFDPWPTDRLSTLIDKLPNIKHARTTRHQTFRTLTFSYPAFLKRFRVSYLGLRLVLVLVFCIV